MDSITHVPATGWKHEFQQVRGRIHLPPGWKLLHAGGIDKIPRTWVKRWSLFDFFIVLIFTVATAKLYSRTLAAIGFITLVLIFHEPAAPRLIWLYLLAGFALLKYLPGGDGKLRRAVRRYQSITAILLLLITVPYAIHALRVGIYPQLEKPWISMNDNMNTSVSVPRNDKFNRMIDTDDYEDKKNTVRLMEKEKPAAPEEMAEYRQLPVKVAGKGKAFQSREAPQTQPTSSSSSLFGYGSYIKKSRMMQYDPKSMTQTGPGLPLWQPLSTIQFSWSGPVEPGQMISLIFTGPGVNCLLAFMRVLLIIVLAAGMFGAGFQRGRGFVRPGLGAFFSSSLFSLSRTVMTAAIMMGMVIFHGGICRAAEIPATGSPAAGSSIAGSPAATIVPAAIPSKELLNELQKRLLERDNCFPSCADLSSIEITIGQSSLALTLQVDAAVNTAIPLPGHARHWLPSKLLMDDIEAPALFRENEVLWMMLPAGRHRIVLEGPIRNQSTFQLPLPMKPRHSKVNSEGWVVQGVQPDGSLDDQIQFKRTAINNSRGAEILENGVLPAFASVERRLLLGLVWKVETTVKRTTPSDSAMVLSIPLLPNESVTTRGGRVRNGEVQVNMNAGRNRFSWESFIEPSDSIILKHALTREWTEIWTLNASPVFHVETSGIPVILHQVNNHWHPTWYPWPGEKVTLTITRPSGVKGRTMTIENSRLELRPGRRSSSAVLTLRIKSSQGGQHTIVLPRDAELQEVSIDGKIQLIRQEGRSIPLPVNPGSQTVQLKWRGNQTRAMGVLYRTPEIDLGSSSVNAAIDLHLPSDRWPLLIGGDHLVGPAVLFWSVVMVVLLLSAGLAMTGLSPLKFHHWFLLGIGMSMSSPAACLFVAGWLVLMDLRKKIEALSPRKFNFMQIGLAGLTLLALASLLFAISRGLIGHPDMNISGNGSSAYYLRWYQDISEGILPGAWVFSLPMLVYRTAMLAWALWISFGLVHILKWGWQQFCQPVMWYSIPRKPFGFRNMFGFNKKENEQSKN